MPEFDAIFDERIATRVVDEEAFGIVTMDESTSSGTAAANTTALNTRLASGYLDDHVQEHLPGAGVLVNGIVLNRSGQKLTAAGGKSGPVAEIVYGPLSVNESEGGNVGRLVGRPSIASVVSLRANGHVVDVNVQGAWHADSNATLISGRPIARPEYEFNNSGQYTTDHASDTRAIVGVEVQATQEGVGTGWNTLYGAVHLCRAAVRLQPFDADANVINNGTDAFYWPQPLSSYNDVMLLINNPQSVDHDIGFLYTSTNSVGVMVAQGGPMDIAGISMGLNTHDGLLILGNDTNTTGPFNIGRCRDDGSNSVVTSFIVRVQPTPDGVTQKHFSSPITLGCHHVYVSRATTNPFIWLENSYGLFRCNGGSSWFNGGIVVKGGTLPFHAKVILDGISFRPSNHPNSVIKPTTSNGYVDVIWMNCMVGNDLIADGSYRWIEGVSGAIPY